jgi:hypothetical protein
MRKLVGSSFVFPVVHLFIFLVRTDEDEWAEEIELEEEEDEEAAIDARTKGIPLSKHMLQLDNYLCILIFYLVLL